jgi:hypothetical protein
VSSIGTWTEPLRPTRFDYESHLLSCLMRLSQLGGVFLSVCLLREGLVEVALDPVDQDGSAPAGSTVTRAYQRRSDSVRSLSNRAML